jgi:hypothetical protein
MIISAHFQEIHDSPLYQQWQKDIPEFSKGEASFQSDTGLAPDNLDQVTIGGDIIRNGPSYGPTIVFQTRNPATADDIRAKIKPHSYQKDFKLEEIKIGNYTAYQPTFHFNFGQPEAKLEHGDAFVVVENNVVLESRDIEGLRKILERGKPAELSETMQLALKNVDASKTVVYAIDLKACFADEQFVKDFQRTMGPMLPGISGDALKQYESLALDATLAAEEAKLRATLLCKDADTAGDAKKMAEAAQVLLRQVIQASPRAPQELADAIKSISFTLDGGRLSATGQAKVDAVVKWMRAEQEYAIEQAKKRAQERMREQLERVRKQAEERGKDNEQK